MKTDIPVIFHKLTIRHCRCKTINGRSKPLTIGRFLRISNLFLNLAIVQMHFPTDARRRDDWRHVSGPATKRAPINRAAFIFIAKCSRSAKRVESTFADFISEKVGAVTYREQRGCTDLGSHWFGKDHGRRTPNGGAGQRNYPSRIHELRSFVTDIWRPRISWSLTSTSARLLRNKIDITLYSWALHIASACKINYWGAPVLFIRAAWRSLKRLTILPPRLMKVR